MGQPALGISACHQGIAVKRALFILAALCLLAGAGVVWGWQQLHRPLTPAQTVFVDIPHGASTKRIAQLLQQQGVIGSARWFELAVRWQGVAAKLASGVYAFRDPASILQVIARLQQGDVAQFQVTIPEGLRNDEILALLAERTGIAPTQWQQALQRVLPGAEEGYLLPETYRYTKPLKAEDLLRQMMAAQHAVLQELTMEEAMWPRLRIMASIIEKETAKAEERALVSAVIHNRLQRGMPLQMDPTVIYGIWKTTGQFSGNIRKHDLAHDTPWNTYTRRGLPPTPICNPGAASLRAAAHPADVDYLYFVADGSGGHAFATTNAEHARNVQRWMRIERQRQ